MPSSARKYLLYQRQPEVIVTTKPLLPKCWLADLIHSQMATGNFGKAMRDAISFAQQNRRTDDAALYRNMLDQISDYWAQRDKPE